MDKEKLITEVFVRLAIWDKRDRRHHNRYVLDKAWAEISNITNMSVIGVINKWKVLRQDFKKNFDKARECRSGNPAPDDLESEWPYFKSLLFLSDQFTPRESDTNLETQGMSVTSPSSGGGHTQDEADDSREDNQEEEAESVSSLPSTSRSSTSTTSKRRHENQQHSQISASTVCKRPRPNELQLHRRLQLTRISAFLIPFYRK